MQVSSRLSLGLVPIIFSVLACVTEERAGTDQAAESPDAPALVEKSESPLPDHVVCTKTKPVVHGVADSRGGRIEHDRARISYPQGAYISGRPLQLLTHPVKHGVKLSPRGSATGSDSVWLRINHPECPVGPPPYFVDNNGEPYPTEQITEGDIEWAVAVIPRSSLSTAQVDTTSEAHTGFVILSN